MTTNADIRPYVYTSLPEPVHPGGLNEDEAFDSHLSVAGERIPRPIRVFKLYPGAPDDSLQGSLWIRGKEEPYEALSYCWGPSADNIYTVAPELTLHHEEGVRVVQITPSLALALKHLRLDKEYRNLWVDALSINQRDQNEKSRQIAIMDKIYRNARQVCIWLGPGHDNSDKAIGLIRRLSRLHEFDRLID